MMRPVRPGGQPPADVIPLSQFRAELGRGRRLRRSDTLLAERDPDAAVRALPADELYYVLHELGHEAGGALLAAATAEQLQVVLDFALWQRDRIVPDALAEWVEAMAHAPPERIARWLAGLDVELVALLLRRGAHIHDLTQGPPPEEPLGTFFPTPDGFFLLDVVGLAGKDGAGRSDADEHDGAAVIIRLVDSLYRTDKDLARRLLVAAGSELDSELEEAAYRWQRGRMADLGFADYYEALEVYRELDLGSVEIGQGHAPRARSSTDAADTNGAALRVPTVLAQRLADVGESPFARAAQRLSGEDVEELRFALVALTNRVLAADRVAPGDDDAVEAALQRLAATLDLAIERLAPGDDGRGAAALRSIPLQRLFRTGVTLIGKARRLALALVRGGPFGRQGVALAEAEDAAVLDALTRPRPLFPRILDQPPGDGERPFRTLADLARAAAAVERAAAAQAMLRGLGIEARSVSPDAPLLVDSGADVAALDAGVLARTVLVGRLLAPGRKAPALAPLDPRDVRAFEGKLQSGRTGPPTLPPNLARTARDVLLAAAPAALAGAAGEVADRWIASLAPLEPVLARKPAPPSKRKPPSPSKRKSPAPPKRKPPALPKRKPPAPPKRKPPAPSKRKPPPSRRKRRPPRR